MDPAEGCNLENEICRRGAFEEHEARYIFKTTYNNNKSHKHKPTT